MKLTKEELERMALLVQMRSSGSELTAVELSELSDLQARSQTTQLTELSRDDIQKTVDISVSTVFEKRDEEQKEEREKREKALKQEVIAEARRVSVGMDSEENRAMSYVGQVYQAITTGKVDEISKIREDFQDLTFNRANNENIDKDGGFAVPNQFYSVLQKVAEKNGLYPKISTAIPIDGKKVEVFLLNDSGIGFTYVGELDNKTKTDGQLVFDKDSANTSKMKCTVSVSRDLLEDSKFSENIGSLIATAITNSWTKTLDTEGFNGEGGTYTISGIEYPKIRGFLNTDNSYVKDIVLKNGATIEDITIEDIKALQLSLPVNQVGSRGFIMNQTTYRTLLDKKGTDGHPIFQNIFTQPDTRQSEMGIVGNLFGQPVLLSEQLLSTTAAEQADKRFIAYGDFKKALFYGFRRKLEVFKEHLIGSDSFQTTAYVRLACGVKDGRHLSFLKTGVAKTK